VFGLGPLSPFWYSLVDPDTNQAKYSLSLSRTGVMSSLGSSGSSSISLGGFSDEDVAYYSGSSNVTMSTTEMNAITYPLQNFSFGEVYQSNGSISSAYYESLSSNADYSATFNLAEYGLALPQTLYNDYMSLLQSVTDNVECSDDEPLYCTLLGSCLNNTDLLLGYGFQVQFNSSSDYLRVPLSTFVYQN